MSMINGVEEIIYKNQSLDFEQNKFVTVVTETLEVCGGALLKKLRGQCFTHILLSVSHGQLKVCICLTNTGLQNRWPTVASTYTAYWLHSHKIQCDTFLPGCVEVWLRLP